MAVEENNRTNLSARTSVLLQRYLLCRMQNKVYYYFWLFYQVASSIKIKK
jgi:hypothetical protein